MSFPKKEDHETIESYVKKMKSIANCLAEINSPVSDQDLILHLLAGLPSQYLLFKNTMSSRFPLPKFSDACSMLYEYEKSSTLPPPPPPKKENETISVEDDDQIKQVQLKIQFHGTKKEDHETIESYVEKLQSIANSLAEINNSVSDQDLVLQLLAGLPSQYSPYQNIISSQSPLPDFPGACSMLYMYETLLHEQKTTSGDHNPLEEGNDNKAAFGKFLDMFNTVSSVVLTACDLWNMFGTSSNKKYYTKRPNGGRGNYNKRGGFRNSGRK